MLIRSALGAADKRRIQAMLFANNGGSGLRQALLDGAPFLAELTHSLVLSRGTGSPTFTRASTATFTDWEGVLRTVPSGCARFEGGGMVMNLLSTTENLLGAGWTAVGGAPVQNVVAPEGTTTGWSKAIANVSDEIRCITTYNPAGRAGLGSVYLKGTGTVSIRVSNSVDQQFVTQFTLTSEWVRVATSVNTANATAGTWLMGIFHDTGDTATSVDVWHPQLEDVTGRTDQTTPSEYVSVGVLSAPYHGAGVDGVKFFNTDRDGALLSPQPAYLAEGARTQILATADIRDMTTAAWILGATMTRARTSVGADGAANSATRLTGGAVAATNTCYTTITAAASSRTYSALVKRVTGTGPVRIVQTGTETDISSLINSSTYTLVELNASILNAVMGFKIDTNGDAIDVDFNQFEAGAFASSRIAAAVTRAADVLTYPSAGNILEATGTAYAEYSSASIDGSYATALGGSGSSAGRMITHFAATSCAINDNTSELTKTGLAAINTGIRKRASTWSAAPTMTVTGDGLAPASTAAYDGSLAPVALGIGFRAATSNEHINGTIRNVRIWQRQLSASEMQAITS